MNMIGPTVTEQTLAAKYGLPKEVAFCKHCVISNQRPGSAIEYQHQKQSVKRTINFDDEGVCSACRVAQQKQCTDWQAREVMLMELCDRYRSKDGSYDCLVPGSGGKDSFYAAHVLKTKYNMHPLTVTWAPHLYTPWGWQNFQSWIHAGFDNYLVTPNGRIHRLLTRLAVENLFHPFQPFIIGQKALAVKMAIKFNLPLVFYGENEAEYGNPISDTQSSQRNWKYFTQQPDKDIFLGGVSVDRLKTDFNLVQSDLEPYLPANPVALQELAVQVHYLGYYLPWHPQGNYYYAVEHGGFIPSPERTAGTYSKYSSIDDKMDDFHYYTTFVKFGIGRATYDAAQEIRNGEITREEGVMLVKRFDGEYPERFEKDVFDYLSIDEKHFPKIRSLFSHPDMDREYFMALSDHFRSPHLWKKTTSGWQQRHTVY